MRLLGIVAGMTSSIVPANALRTKLSSGSKAVGTMVAEFRQPAVIQLLANASFDFVIIDCEHGPFSLETVADLARVGSSLGITPIARVPELGYVPIATALDAGAQGVMVPRIYTAAEAAQAVSIAKYPPAGERGCALGRGHTRFRGGDVASTMADANAQTMVVIQIETREALEAIDDIVAVPGVDVAFVGPTDLSIALGVPGQVGSAEIEQAILRVAAACRRAGVWSAVQMNDVTSAARWSTEVDIMSFSSDAGILAAAGGVAAAAIREASSS